jgi:SET domain-containing protein
MISQPKCWPPQLPYLTAPAHSKSLTKEQLASIQTRNDKLDQIPADATQLPCPLVKITPISGPSHPANGQYGLFATKHLKPGTFILLYLGSVQPGSEPTPSNERSTTVSGTAATQHSDYELWLDKDATVAVDAEKRGNEARFINDFRGVKDRPNAEFREVWSARHRERCMAVFVLSEGKKSKAKTKASAGIVKGDEILVSYGKGFWAHRFTAAAAMPEESTWDRELVPPTTK